MSPVSASMTKSSVPDFVTRLTYHLAWSLPWGEKLIRNGVLEKLLCCPLPLHKSIQPWLSNQRSNSLGFILSSSNFLSSFSSLISFLLYHIYAISQFLHLNRKRTHLLLLRYHSYNKLLYFG